MVFEGREFEDLMRLRVILYAKNQSVWSDH